MNRYISFLVIGALVLGGFFLGGCGSSKSVSSTKTTPVSTTAGKELQITNVQMFPTANASTKMMDVIFKATNPNADYCSYMTYVKMNLYDAQNAIVGTANSCIWTVYPGSRWSDSNMINCVGDPVRVETQPTTQSWQKIVPANIPKFTVTQSTTSGTTTVGSVRYEGSSKATQIQIVGVVLDANGSVINYGLGNIQNPTVGDNAFNLSLFIEGSPTAPLELSFELVG